MTSPLPQRFLRSLGDEVRVQANRVRDLIGSKHWLSDGKHKEALIGAVMERYIPSHIRVCNGFVVSPTNIEQISHEVDLMLVDNSSECTLHSQFGFTICFANQLVGAISIKTAFSKPNVKDTLENLQSIAMLFDETTRPLLTGIFIDSEHSTNAIVVSFRKWIREDPDIRALLLANSAFDLQFSCDVHTIVRLRRSDLGGKREMFVYQCDGTALSCAIVRLAGACQGPTHTQISLTQFAGSMPGVELIDCIELES